MRTPEETFEYLQKNNKPPLKDLSRILIHVEEAVRIYHGHDLYRERVKELRALLRETFDITEDDIKEIEESAVKVSKEIKEKEKNGTFGSVSTEAKKNISVKALIGTAVIAFGTGIATRFVVKKITNILKKE